MSGVNFAPRGWPRWVGWLGLLAGGLAAAAVQFMTTQLSEERDRLLAERVALTRMVQSVSPDSRQGEGLSGSRTTAKRLSQLRSQMDLPWQLLFAALEVPPPPDVHLLAVEPEPESGMVRLQAQAATLELVPGYLAHLDAQPGWSGCRLVSHRLMDPSQPQGAVRFVVTAQWRAPHE